MSVSADLQTIFHIYCEGVFYCFIMYFNLFALKLNTHSGSQKTKI